MSIQSSVPPGISTQIELIAHQFLQSTKSWNDSDYRLEFLREERGPNGRILVLDAFHLSDTTVEGRGPWRSVQLHIDPQANKVIKELAYQ